MDEREALQAAVAAAFSGELVVGFVIVAEIVDEQGMMQLARLVDPPDTADWTLNGWLAGALDWIDVDEEDGP